MNRDFMKSEYNTLFKIIKLSIACIFLLDNIAWAMPDALRPLVGNLETYEAMQTAQKTQKDPIRSLFSFENALYCCINEENIAAAKEEFGKRIGSIAMAFRKVSFTDKQYGYGWMQAMRAAALRNFERTVAEDIDEYLSTIQSEKKKSEREKLERDLEYFRKAIYSLHFVTELRKAMEVPGERIAIHLNRDEMYDNFFGIIRCWVRTFEIRNLNEDQRLDIVGRTGLFLKDLTKFAYDTGETDSWYSTKSAVFRSHGRDVLTKTLRICIDRNFSNMESVEDIDEFFDKMMNHMFIRDVIEEAEEEIAAKRKEDAYEREQYARRSSESAQPSAANLDIGESYPPAVGRRGFSSFTPAPDRPSLIKVKQSVELRLELRQQLLQVLTQSQTIELLEGLELNMQDIIKRRGFIDDDSFADVIEAVKDRVRVEFERIKGKMEFENEDEEKMVDEVIESFLKNIEASSWAFARKYISTATDLEDARAQMLYDIEMNHRVITEEGNTYFEAKDGMRFITQDTMYLIGQFSLAAILFAFRGETAGSEVLPAIITDLVSVIPEEEIHRKMENDREHFLKVAEELYEMLKSEPEKYQLWMKDGSCLDYLYDLGKLIDMAKYLRNWPQDFKKQIDAYIALYGKVLEFTGRVYPKEYKLLKDMDEGSLESLYSRLKEPRIVNDMMIIGRPEQLKSENSISKVIVIGIPGSGQLSGIRHEGVKMKYIIVIGGLTHELMLREGIQCYAKEFGIKLDRAILRDSLRRVSYADMYLCHTGDHDIAVAYNAHGVSSLRPFVDNALKGIGCQDTKINIQILPEEKAAAAIRMPEGSTKDVFTAATLNMEESVIGKLFDLAEKGFRLRKPDLIAYARSQLQPYRDRDLTGMYVKARLPLLLGNISIAEYSEEGDFDIHEYVQFLREFGEDEMVLELRDILKDNFAVAAKKADAVCALGHLPRDAARYTMDIFAIANSEQDIHLTHASWGALERIASSEETLKLTEDLIDDTEGRCLKHTVGKHDENLLGRISKLRTLVSEIGELKRGNYKDIDFITSKLSEVAQIPFFENEENREAVKLFGDIARISCILINHIKAFVGSQGNTEAAAALREDILFKPIYDRIEIKPALYQLLFLATQSLITGEEFRIGLIKFAKKLQSAKSKDTLPGLIKKYYDGNFVPLSEDEKNWFNIIFMEALASGTIIRDSDIQDEKDRNQASKPGIEDIEVVTVCPKFFIGFSVNLLNLPGNISPLIEAGGGGSDVAKVLRNTEMPFMLLGFKGGGSTGKIVANLLEKYGISTTDLTPSHKSLIIKTAITPGIRPIKISPKTYTVSSTERRRLLSQIDDVITKIGEVKKNKRGYNPVFVLTGSLPVGIGDDFYAIVVNKCKEKGIRVIVDTTGKGLLRTMEAGPFLIKPNEEEFKNMVVDFIINKKDNELSELLSRYYDEKKGIWRKELEYEDYAELAAEIKKATGVENILNFRASPSRRSYWLWLIWRIAYSSRRGLGGSKKL
ncbi:MAG: hypothetical protein NTX47_00585 [Candidatus Omnitrophica bacterium]|nr:hypothetical protein [Candidatus Omnitrophota bacterium]